MYIYIHTYMYYVTTKICVYIYTYVYIYIDTYTPTRSLLWCLKGTHLGIAHIDKPSHPSPPLQHQLLGDFGDLRCKGNRVHQQTATE